MESLFKALEIFALLTGLLYIVLEIRQKNLMWIVGIASGIACSVEFGLQHLYASMGLNIYYVIVSVWGLYCWRRDLGKIGNRSPDDKGGDQIHLSKLPMRVALISFCFFVVLSAVLMVVLHLLGDPCSYLDSTVTVLSAIGMIWLARSYSQQWFVWVAADSLSALMCLTSGMWWMAGLYLAYVLSSVYGYHYWKKNGVYVV